MRMIISRSLALVLAVIMLWSMVGTVMAATYRPGAQSGPSSSYKGGRYYDNYTRVPITGECLVSCPLLPFLVPLPWNSSLLLVSLSLV